MQRVTGLPNATQEMLSLSHYGLAMQGAQMLEYKLAILCVLIETQTKVRDKPPKNLEKAMGPIVRRVEHAFQKASASELRNRLEGRIDPGLLDEMSRLIKVRDRLAHRYLREQYVLDPPVFGDRMFRELEAIIFDFNQLNERVDRAIAEAAEAKGHSDDDGLLPVVAGMGMRLMYGDLE